MKLVCLDGAEKDSTWELSGSRIIIGRDSLCDVIISDPKLSRIHAEIVRKDQSFVFHDRESRNGSFINNRRIEARTLVAGDRIKIGDTTIKVIEDFQTAEIDWHLDDPLLITMQIPLGGLKNQLEEIIGAPGMVIEERAEIPDEEQVRTAKLIKNLETVYKVGSTINSIRNVDELLDQVAKALMDVFPEVQSVSILLKEKGKDFEPKLVRTRPDIPAEASRISWSIVSQAVKNELCIVANDATHDTRFAASESIMALNLRSVMCAPLVNNGLALGVLYLDNREKPDCFDEDDVALLSALANQSAVALDNSRLYEDVQKAYHEAILALLNTVEAKDPYTRGHSQRTSRYAFGVAQQMGLSEKECGEIKTAAQLHDIGKIGITDIIIGKDSPLSTMEFHSIQDHVLIGEKIIRPIEYLSFAAVLIRHHHEYYDGSGYPDGLKQGQIPLGARIIALTDAFDAMTTQRPYNKPLSFNEALEECKTLRGKQFDPDVVDALVRFIEQKSERRELSGLGMERMEENNVLKLKESAPESHDSPPDL